MTLLFIGLLWAIGMLVILLSTNKIVERKSREKDRIERSLKELEVGFKQLDQKYLDLYMEVDQMRNILKINGFEKDVDIPSTLRTLHEKIETVRLNYEFDKKSNNEIIGALSQDILMVRKFVTRVASGNEY